MEKKLRIVKPSRSWHWKFGVMQNNFFQCLLKNEEILLLYPPDTIKVHPLIFSCSTNAFEKVSRMALVPSPLRVFCKWNLLQVYMSMSSAYRVIFHLLIKCLICAMLHMCSSSSLNVAKRAKAISCNLVLVLMFKGNFVNWFEPINGLMLEECPFSKSRPVWVDLLRWNGFQPLCWCGLYRKQI